MLKNYIKSICIGLIYLIKVSTISSQCGQLKCGDAEILCSLSELNGITCTALSSPDGINCNQQPDYITYWSFLSVGSNTITITPLVGCNNNSSLEVNLGYYCECNPISSVTVTNTPKTIHYDTKSCAKLILSIKNSNNSTCQYSITTSSATLPRLSGNLGKINNNNNGQIEICQTQCEMNFFIPYTGFKNACEPRFEWTLDGVINTQSNGKNAKFTFPNEGTYELCVTGFLYKYRNTLKCIISDPVCAIVKVSTSSIRSTNIPRLICSDKFPFKWGNTMITEEGTYTATFSSDCCNIDSTVEFKYVYPQLFNTYFISCDGSIYSDPLTKIVYPECFSKKKISFNANPAYGCNNYYYLSTSYPKIKPKWIINNVNGNIEIDPNIQIKDLCDAQIGIESYGWFKKSDPQQTIISKNKKLSVATPDNYCLNYLATIKLGPESQVCSFTFCEPFTQAPIADFISNKQTFCPGTNVTFTEQCSQDAIAWHWELTGADPSESTLRNPTVYYDKPGIYPVKLTVENQYFSSTITKTTYINVIKSPLCNIKEKRKKKFPIGIGGLVENELQERSSYDQDIKVLPNPNNGSFVIKGIEESEEIITLNMFNNLGQQVYNKSITQVFNNPISINAENLEEGSYWLRITNSYIDKVYKIIIIK